MKFLLGILCGAAAVLITAALAGKLTLPTSSTQADADKVADKVVDKVEDSADLADRIAIDDVAALDEHRHVFDPDPASIPIDPTIVETPSLHVAESPIPVKTDEGQSTSAQPVEPISEPTTTEETVADPSTKAVSETLQVDPATEASLTAEASEIGEAPRLVEESRLPPEPLPAVAVWTPFYSEASAQGFANRLTGAVEEPFAVRKIAAAEYLVTFQPESAEDWYRVRDAIAKIFGSPDAP